MSVVIVTGGTFGLGQSITVDLARRGHQVVAFGLRDRQPSSVAEGFESVQAELDRASVRADLLEADVSAPDDVQRVVDHAVQLYGAINGLVNNAAIGPLGTVLDTDVELFDRIVAVNLRGTYLMCRAVLPAMIRQGGGSIVNIGSGAGWGKPNMAAYAASKGAIASLSAAMAYDHFHQHVRVNVAIPGGGGIVSGIGAGRVGGDVETLKRRAVSGTVAGRPMTGQDLANTVAFLLSDEAATISGTVIDVGCFDRQGGPIPPKPRTMREAP